MAELDIRTVTRVLVDQLCGEKSDAEADVPGMVSAIFDAGLMSAFGHAVLLEILERRLARLQEKRAALVRRLPCKARLELH